ncbi:hypothetical protein ACFX13_046872 [Malus domestica]
MRDHGAWHDNDAGIEGVVIDYFSTIFSSDHPPLDGEIMDVIDKRVTDDMNSSLTQHFDVDEVKRAVFQMQPSTSLGLDGLPPLFFQKFWGIVGEDNSERHVPASAHQPLQCVIQNRLQGYCKPTETVAPSYSFPPPECIRPGTSDLGQHYVSHGTVGGLDYDLCLDRLVCLPDQRGAKKVPLPVDRATAKRPIVPLPFSPLI